MTGRAAKVRVVAIMALICGCSGGQESSGGTGGSANGGSASGGSEPGSGGSADPSGGHSGAPGSGGLTQASGGESGGEPQRCAVVDGEISYGPIGAPEPWPLETVSSPAAAQSFAAFRIPTGYGLVWNTFEEAPTPNLFSMTVGPNFEGGEPRALPSTIAPYSLAVAPGPSGFVVSTCSVDEEPEWLWLNSDLSAAELPSFAPAGARCYLSVAPAILWTGERYLTTFSDERGLILASLDEAGALVRDEVLVEKTEKLTFAQLSKNGDSVLVVFSAGPVEKLRYRLLDLKGTPLSDAEPFGVESDAHPTGFFIAPTADGWHVINDAGSSQELPATLTAVSRNGVAETGQAFGELGIVGFSPSAHGGSLLVGSWYEDDLHGSTYSLKNVIDDGGAVVYSDEQELTHSDEPWLVDIVVDPLRDLIVEDQVSEGASGRNTRVVQEYGCLE